MSIPIFSHTVYLSGDDARHASNHDTKGHALCVPLLGLGTGMRSAACLHTPEGASRHAFSTEWYW